MRASDTSCKVAKTGLTKSYSTSVWFLSLVDKSLFKLSTCRSRRRSNVFGKVRFWFCSSL